MSDALELDDQVFAQVVKNAPLVSIDIILQDPQGKIFLGRRRNQPAKGKWFVPGGRIRKGERLDQAIHRIVREELGVDSISSAAEFVGVFEHFYEDNFAAEAGYGTHFVVLAYEFLLELPLTNLPPEQHTEFRWWDIEELIKSPEVHIYTKAYFS
ncbi:MAG: GDP-mannose mannosyl hydrolase [Chloroflexota bacterium]|nr:GDP-mannose mannosyl hydrolase [Chloroflexota bacterium]